MRSRPRARSQSRGGVEQRRRAPRDRCSISRKPNIPHAFWWNSLKAWSIWALIRPTTRPSRRARNSCASPCLKYAFEAPVEERPALQPQRRYPLRLVSMQPVRELDELPLFPPRAHGRAPRATRRGTLHAHRNRSLREGPHARSPGAAAGGARARPAALLPPAGGPGRPGRGDGGPRAHHARRQQLPRADGRRARQAGRPRRAGALRHRRDRLALHERHDADPPGARARARRVDGHRRRARLQHRLPGEHWAASPRCWGPRTP